MALGCLRQWVTHDLTGTGVAPPSNTGPGGACRQYAVHPEVSEFCNYESQLYGFCPFGKWLRRQGGRKRKIPQGDHERSLGCKVISNCSFPKTRAARAPTLNTFVNPNSPQPDCPWSQARKSSVLRQAEPLRPGSDHASIRPSVRPSVRACMHACMHACNYCCSLGAILALSLSLRRILRVLRSGTFASGLSAKM